jgi:hypothetical protein
MTTSQVSKSKVIKSEIGRLYDLTTFRLEGLAYEP